MAIYVVMEPGESGPAESDRTVYVRDGFSMIAFLVPVIWLLWHRLWIEALLVLAAGMALGTLSQVFAVAPIVVLSFSLLIGLYVGLEGPALRLAALGRRGWSEWGVVKADNRDEAEARYLSEALSEDAGETAPPEPNAAEPRARPAPVGPALGLLDYPGSL